MCTRLRPDNLSDNLFLEQFINPLEKLIQFARTSLILKP